MNRTRCGKRAVAQSAVTLAIVLFSACTARAGELWTWTMEGAGQGTANVFDGGPVVTSMGHTTGPHDSLLMFAATDRTRVGSQGATYSTGGESDVRINGDALTVVVKFDTTYIGGFTSQDDHTGGEGEGSLWSVIELVLPADDLTWGVQLQITDTPFFSGSSYVKFENVTQGNTLLELDSPFLNTRTLFGSTGDVVRISSQISGQGFFPATVLIGALRSYEGFLTTWFVVPEPSTLALLAAGVALITNRRRWLL